jgi:multicomponent Na+:H+ antiporter subunit D
MDWLLILPIMLPLAAAAVSLPFGGRPRLQRSVALLGASGLLLAALALAVAVWREGVRASRIGGWPAPVGITLVADVFSAVMVVTAGVVGVLTVIYSLATIDRRRQAYGYYSLVLVLLAGVCGAFLTGDAFNLYVWFEVLLIASFVLLALGGERGQIEGAVKYVTLNLVSSAFFLSALGLLYGVSGTLNFADLALTLPTTASPGLTAALSMLFLAAFGIKAAIFPLFSWLPAAYHTPPVAVTALFSALLTKVGVYALVRVFSLVFEVDVGITRPVLLTLAALTMATGVLGAIAQNEIRRLLSFHIVSQIGYLVFGLALFSVASLAGLVFFMVHVIAAKSALFFAGGAVERLCGSSELKRTGGLAGSAPGIAGLFLVAALALAGLPPLSGFVAKLALVEAGLDGRSYLLVAVALGVSVLTLFSMLKIWNEAFWKPPPSDAPPRRCRLPAGMVAPLATLALVTVLLGVAGGPAFAVAERAARQLVDPVEYIDAALGERR